MASVIPCNYLDTDSLKGFHSPMQALIIGIDIYKSKGVKNLEGAVADADDMDNFLRTDLQVPNKQIVNLRNEQATRSAILTQLKALQKRDARKGDPFLVFFAGHGALAKAPDGHPGGKHVSMIVPYDGDVAAVPQKDCTDNIPDWTIGTLLDQLAARPDGKGEGDNVTVIFDCCHSGSGTRSLLRARRVVMEDGYKVPHDLDKEVASNTPKSLVGKDTRGFFRPSLKSHVLLSACREGEIAYERDGRGQFTEALLRTLRTTSIHKITYRELMKRVEVKGQVPQCEGYHTDRPIFDARSPSRGRLVYAVSQGGGKFTLDAGLVHGVDDGSQFAIYPSLDSADIPLTTMVATSVKPFSAGLSIVLSAGAPAPILPSPCFAVQTSLGTGSDWALRLHVPSDKEHSLLIEALTKERCRSHIVQVRHSALADLSVRASSGHIEYLICDPTIRSYGLSKLCQTTKSDADCIRPVLRATADFFRHLRRSPLPKERLLETRIAVEVHALKENTDGNVDPYVQPLLTRYGENLCRSGKVDLTARDDETVYGITLRNSSQVPLYVWVFYFDCSDLSIAEFYRPPAMCRGAEAPLPAKGDLSIGFGPHSGEPFECALRPDQEIDVGFLKFFLLTQPADLSGVEQMSPFESKRPRDIKLFTREVNTWDTVTIPVQSRRSVDKSKMS